MEIHASPAGRGRPREFDSGDALRAALRIFRTEGYEAASLNDLTAAMGLSRPSLYAAFGNKQALFRQALDLYEREQLAFFDEALEAPTAFEVARGLLSGTVRLQTQLDEPRGCIRMISAAARSPDADSVRALLGERRQVFHRRLCARLERAKSEGDLPADSDPAMLAAFLDTLMQGIAVQAGNGASRAELDGVVDAGLATWPGP